MSQKAAEMSGLRKAAVLLVKLGKDDSAKLLAQLPEAEGEELSTEIARLGLVEPEASANVAHRIAVMDRTSPEIIKQVVDALARKFSSVLQPSEMSVVGGVQPLVDIINRADRATERLILEGLEQRSPEIAEEIR